MILEIILYKFKQFKIINVSIYEIGMDVKNSKISIKFNIRTPHFFIVKNLAG